MKQSAIGWCDYSGGNLNFVTGCTPVSAGCVNCYARSIYERFGKDFSRVQVHPDKLARLAKQRFGVPVHLNNGAVEYVSPKRGGHRPMCFPVDMGDLFHEDVPDAFIMEALTVMLHRPDVIWQVLTKRPERMRAHLHEYWRDTGDGALVPMPNIWFGVTAENQAMADERIPILLDTPAAVRWVSVEPMLGPVRLNDGYSSWLTCTDTQEYHDYEDSDHECCESFAMGCGHFHGIDWVVCGGESGANRRPFDTAWAVALYEECRQSGTPYFFKQSGALKPGTGAVLPGVGVVQEWPA